MSIHEINGRFYDTEKAVAKWESKSEYTWLCTTLYKSSKGIFYKIIYDKVIDHFVEETVILQDRVAKYLLVNHHTIPEDLKQYAPEIE